ncbi:hypothetical protein [Prauserella muralis]|uniref:hypothetical protein n=1 Tax=Prauserella muralis TaxID=588067 RepID=UPI0011ADEB0E|nr:hypothetical protein [Prauserella muralis]TWE28522.1 hypothetical protein FHX69_1179 [Prauserella muralis]
MSTGPVFLTMLLYALLPAVFLFALYFVVRAAVRDGIRLACGRGDGGAPTGMD